MQSDLKKFLAALTLVSFLANFYLLARPKRAEAFLGTINGLVCDQYANLFISLDNKIKKAISGILGGFSIKLKEVPTTDKTAQAKIDLNKRAQAKIDCQNFLKKAALEALKQRILDKIVADTVRWIQGGGKPAFVTDFGKFLEDAAQAAAGDVIQEIGLGELCSPFRAKLKLAFETSYINPPPFSQEVKCTLNQVVNNIQDFWNDFSKGGWRAFEEALKPQNNYFGALIIAQEEINSRIDARLQIGQAEFNVGQGFLGTKKCLEWEAQGDYTDPSLPKPLRAAFDDLNTFPAGPFPDPSNPPQVLVPGIDNLRWVCSKAKTTTPGSVIAGVTNRAANLKTDAILTANDIEDYIFIIANALTSRLIKIGKEGILGLTFDDNKIDNDLQKAGRDYDQTFDGITKSANPNTYTQNLIQNLLLDLNNASSSLTDTENNIINGIDVNQMAADSANTLVQWCNTVSTSTAPFSNRDYHPTSCREADNLLDDSNNNISELNLLSNQVNNALVTLINLIARANAYLVNQPDDTTLNQFVDQVNQFVDLVNNLQQTSVNLIDGGNQNWQRADQIFAACTDGDDTTRCP